MTINENNNDLKQNSEDKRIPEIENYIHDEIDAQIDEHMTFNSIEDHFETMKIDVDDFKFELTCELKKRHRQLNSGENNRENSKSSATAQKYEYWINILNQIDGFITSRELDVLDKCISGYAAECYPEERIREIKRNLYYQLNGWSECDRVDLLELDYKLNHIDVLLLFELTEILLEFENLFYCSTIPDNSHDPSKRQNALSFSAFLYHREKSGIDYIQEYEIFTELYWINSGLIKEYWEADHVVNFYFANGSYHPEYDYVVYQIHDNDQQNIDSIDLGSYDCLSDDDLFQNTWLNTGKKFQNYIDYFWDAEITDLFQNEDRDFYTKYRDGFSEDTLENYSKYRCMEGDSGFIFCKKENCEGCNHINTKKVINPQYRLWKKYVEPLTLA